ncbi:MAG TPA: DUF4402 domain-containing protein [Salinimicrobium sp.]|nr:DUF4402 domain-containing protein [Salinimicrobium sp.]
MKRLIFSLIVLALYTGTLRGQSQASANFTASVTIIEPIGITTTANMNFARIDARSGGIVTLTPENTRVSTGGVQLEGGGMVSAATFKITGQKGYAYAVSLPQEAYTLSSGENEIIIENFQSNLSSGTLKEEPQIIRVGASLRINPNQTPGFYTSRQSFQVTVNYN